MPTLKYIDGVGQAGYLPVRAPVVSINGKTGVLEYDILKPYCTLAKIKPYLYNVGFLSIDYEYAKSYFESHDIPVSGACSAVRNGNLYGRQFDWTYDETVEFVVDIPQCGNRFASLGIAGSISALTEESMSGDIEDAMKLVPFFTQDGINEYGLTVSTLVVPSEGNSNVSVPTVEQRESLCGIMLVRYMLDHFKTAHEAVNYISKYVSVWFPSKLHEMDYEQHYIVADKTDTYILEFVNNAAVITDVSDHPYTTNFLINDVIFNEDGTVYTPATLASGSPTTDNHITDHGSGLERYNLIADGYSTCNTIEGMRALLSELNYTRAYSTSEDPSDPYWYTEFVANDIHCDSTVSEFSEVVEEAGTAYSSRTRNGATWQTVHSVVYDISAKTMSLITQEDGLELIFDLGELYQRVENLETKIRLVSSDLETKVDKTTTVNGHPLSANVTVSDTDIVHDTETVGAALTRIDRAIGDVESILEALL